MSRQVFVAMWQLPTGGNELRVDFVADSDMETKCGLIDTMLQHAEIEIRQLPVTSKGNEKPITIFLAPEYYFKKGNARNCYSRSDRDVMVKSMHKLAKNHADTLIIPGTIMWSKSAIGKADKARKRLETAVQFGGLSKEDREKGDQKLKKSGLFNTAYLARNTAYMFYNSTAYKYHKMVDASEVIDAESESTIFIPGDRPGIFTLPDGGPKVGVQICADHDVMPLWEMVDLHIVVSASVTKKDKHLNIRDGGYFIHCDTKPIHNEVFQVHQNKPQARNQVGSKPVDHRDFFSQEYKNVGHGIAALREGPRPIRKSFDIGSVWRRKRTRRSAGSSPGPSMKS